MLAGSLVPTPPIATRWLLAALIASGFAGCSASDSPTTKDAPGRGVYVPASWSIARTVSGHQRHVAEHRVPCAKCHAFTDNGVGSVHVERCASCHEKESRLEHAVRDAQALFGAGVTTDCRTCHAFTLSGVEDGTAPPPPTDCARCHERQQGAIPAVVVHGSNECVTCHRVHEDAQPSPAPCSTCHEDVTTEHAKNQPETEVCTTCHQHQHAPASDARNHCADCHGRFEPKVPSTALFSDGHTACVGCHRPHDFEKGKAVDCRSCHADMAVLGAPRVRAHTACASCHAPHDVKGSPSQACASCHRDVHVGHPNTRGGACVSCHDPHPAAARAHDRARPCSGCHQTAHSETDFHAGVACTQCHAPHGFVLDLHDRATCTRCHAQQVNHAATLAGHQNCASCHRGLPHRPAALRAGCETCHGDVQRQANAGHARCTSCHEPHGGTVSAPCASCHRDEKATAPAGHQNCTSCHEQHSGAPTRATCAGCHRPEARSAHGSLAQGCATCHRPHGPEGVARPPACATCHQPANLAGLHRSPQHQSCERCHSGHDAAKKPMRDSCLACHTDRRNHFPDAPSCASCHLFGPTR